MPDKPITIHLDRERTLRFDLNALVALEEAVGMPLPALLRGALGATAIRAMLWAGLLHEDERLTLAQVGAMVEGADLSQVQEVLGEALGVRETTGS